MVAKLVVLIFASFFIQDAVFSEQVLSDTARAQDDRAAVKADQQQNSGKIWNWTFGNASPAANEGKLKTPSGADNAFYANDRAFKVEKSPFQQQPGQVAMAHRGAAAAFKAPFQKESRPRVVPPRNPVNFRNQANNKLNKRYESEEYDFDDSDDDNSYDSQSASSQSDDDEDDFSPENRYPVRTNIRNQQNSTPFPMNKRGPKMVPEMERPAMQTRSLQMRTLHGHPRRYGSVSM